MTTMIFREIVLSMFAIILTIWIWRSMKGLARHRRWIGTLVFLAIIAIFGPYLQKWFEDRLEAWKTKAKTPPLGQSALSSRELRYECILEPGVYLHGVNRSGGSPAEIVKRDDQNLWIDLYIIVDNEKQITRFRLNKVGEKYWRGPWQEDDPPHSGICNLIEVGDCLVGSIVLTRDVKALCIFTPIVVPNPNRP